MGWYDVNLQSFYGLFRIDSAGLSRSIVNELQPMRNGGSLGTVGRTQL